jgi:hypothetical protein
MYYQFYRDFVIIQTHPPRGCRHDGDRRFPSVGADSGGAHYVRSNFRLNLDGGPNPNPPAQNNPANGCGFTVAGLSYSIHDEQQTGNVNSATARWSSFLGVTPTVNGSFSLSIKGDTSVRYGKGVAEFKVAASLVNATTLATVFTGPTFIKNLSGAPGVFAVDWNMTVPVPNLTLNQTYRLVERSTIVWTSPVFPDVLSARSAYGVQLVATPLPSTWTLMGFGFAGLGLLAYDGQRRSAPGAIG